MKFQRTNMVHFCNKRSMMYIIAFGVKNMTDETNPPIPSDAESKIQELTNNAPKFDFDAMSALYKTNPEEFQRVTDKLRNDTIDYWIENEDKAQRMRAKAFRQNAELRNVKHPLVRAEKAFGTMLDSLDEMRLRLNELAAYSEGESPHEPPINTETETNNVIPFKSES